MGHKKAKVQNCDTNQELLPFWTQRKVCPLSAGAYIGIIQI